MTNPIPLFANPGQVVTFSLQTIDGYGARVDGYVPRVMQVLFPDLTASSGFPSNMQRIGTGLYIHQLTIPAGATSVGTFIVSTLFTDPDTNSPQWDVFLINVALPFGNSSISPL